MKIMAPSNQDGHMITYKVAAIIYNGIILQTRNIETRQISSLGWICTQLNDL